jgi:hypothetical protein
MGDVRYAPSLHAARILRRGADHSDFSLPPIARNLIGPPLCLSPAA